MHAQRLDAGAGAAQEDAEFKSSVRSAWAMGDYHQFAVATIWPLGALLVEACGITRGQHVLDVAAGTGNTAIRAAKAGATVVASDLTPEHFPAGRRAAAAAGVELEWVEGDAEALPFPDDSFDVVTSSFGAIFAPNHQAVADEMLRVCRPGGTVGMLAFRPRGVAAAFFDLFTRHGAPMPPGSSSPLLWGEEGHVRALFGNRVASLELTAGEYVERCDGGADGYRALFERTFGPVIALRTALAASPQKLAAFDRDFRDFTVSNNRGSPVGRAEYPYEYLLIRLTTAR